MVICRGWEEGGRRAVVSQVQSLNFARCGSSGDGGAMVHTVVNVCGSTRLYAFPWLRWRRTRYVYFTTRKKLGREKKITRVPQIS